MKEGLTWLSGNSGKWIMTGIVLLVIASVALAWDWLRAQFNGWLALILGALALLIGGLLMIYPARAHDLHRPELDGWFGSLSSGRGACCGSPKVDATVLVDADWESKSGRYRVRIEGQWHDVPGDAVLNRPNLYGRALVWPIKGSGGIEIRCFMPGPMT